MRWLVLLQTATGTALLGAALAKATTKSSLRPFLTAMAFQPRAVPILAAGVPLVEGTCGLLLLAGAGLAPAAVAAGLSVAFTATLVMAWRSGVRVGCRCFGAIDGHGFSPVSVARAAVLAVAGLLLLVAGLGAPAGAWRLAADGDTAVSVLLGVAAAVVYVTVLALLDQVYSFERGRRTRLAALRRPDRHPPGAGGHAGHAGHGHGNGRHPVKEASA